MLTLPPVVRVFVALDPIDMRQSFDGLTAAVAARMRLDPLSGHLFVFLNRSRSLMKVLFWDRSGLCILYNQLASHYTSCGSRIKSSPAASRRLLSPRSTSVFHRLGAGVGGLGPGSSSRYLYPS